MICFVLGNVERRTKDVDVLTTEKVWRSCDSSPLPLVPFALHDFVVLAIATYNSMCSGEIGQNVRARDVTAFLKESMTYSKAGEFTDPSVLSVGSGRERESRKRGPWEVLEIEMREQIRCHLGPQVVHVSCGRHWVEWLAVDQFERPGTNAHDHIISAQLFPPLQH
jgi:hypothetical protein